MANTAPFPSHAKVVIVGGGIMGCGLAYHLAHEGLNDVVLLEKAELTSGSTWHAAGQITQSTSSLSLARCVEYNIDLYANLLESETEQSVSWHGCGSFRLAYSDDEVDWLKQTLSVGRSLNFNMELVDPDFIAKHHPFYNLDGVIAGLFTPDDGHVDPSGVTQALAKGARQLGVRIIRRCRATHIEQSENGEWLVTTELGTIRCEHVVNAGGTYARQMGEWSGLQLPMTSMTHHYFVTDSVPEFEQLTTELPVIRDDQRVSGYIRMEQKSGLIGIYEKENPNPVWLDHCPWDAENELFEADYDRVMPWLSQAMDRMPVFADLGIKRVVHGAISHPPDGNPLIGPAPGVRNYWCCCGTQIGIGWGPGLTRELARWIVHGSADISMREFDPRRFGDYANKSWQVIKASEDYCLRHEIPYPHYNRLAGRPLKPSALYDTLQSQGAVFEEVYGHERPRWFATPSVPQRDHYSFRRTRVNELIDEEVKNIRNHAGIIDLSAFTKVEVSGEGAAELLNFLTTNKLPHKDGGIVLTYLLNQRGRIEIEATCVRFGEQRYYLVCAAFFEQRLLDHLSTHLAASGLSQTVAVTNLSSTWGALAINGPKSRDILAASTSDLVDNSAFPWLTAQEINIAGFACWALRLSYAGELGWEIHAPKEHLLPIYQALSNAGKQHNVINYGSFAMNIMRMEKGFKGASELTNEVTVVEADVMRFVDMGKSFLGKDPTKTCLSAPKKWLCVCLSINHSGEIEGHGGEAVLINDKTIGSISSIIYSPTTKQTLAFAYLHPTAITSDDPLQVVIAGAPYAAVVLKQAAYDPTNELPKQ